MSEHIQYLQTVRMMRNGEFCNFYERWISNDMRLTYLQNRWVCLKMGYTPIPTTGHLNREIVICSITCWRVPLVFQTNPLHPIWFSCPPSWMPTEMLFPAQVRWFQLLQKGWNNNIYIYIRPSPNTDSILGENKYIYIIIYIIYTPKTVSLNPSLLAQKWFLGPHPKIWKSTKIENYAVQVYIYIHIHTHNIYTLYICIVI